MLRFRCHIALWHFGVYPDVMVVVFRASNFSTPICANGSHNRQLDHFFHRLLPTMQPSE